MGRNIYVYAKVVNVQQDAKDCSALVTEDANAYSLDLPFMIFFLLFLHLCHLLTLLHIRYAMSQMPHAGLFSLSNEN